MAFKVHASTMRLEHYDHLPDGVLQEVDAGLEEHNRSVAPLSDVEPLAVALFDEADGVIGAAVGRSWGLCCELLQLWVAERYRNQGHGGRLLQAFERDGARRGCTVFYLTTFSFQAPEFYARRGYGVLARIEGYPDGIARYLMQRRA